MNNSGKVLTIFIIIALILMLSLTAMFAFRFYQESELRKLAEVDLDQLKESEAKLQADLKEAKRQIYLLEEKSKESDESIENLTGEIDFQKGIKEEVQAENVTLKKAVEKTSQELSQLRDEFTTQLKDAEQKNSALQAKLDEELALSLDLRNKRAELEEKIKNYQIQLGEDITMINNSDSATMTEPPQVKLDPIVVRPMGDVQGKILTVDQDTQFIIFDLAEGEGVLEGSVMSVYRGNEYLGDIKVTRVQPEMSAADFIPPLTSQHVNKDDLVIPKAKE